MASHASSTTSAAGVKILSVQGGFRFYDMILKNCNYSNFDQQGTGALHVEATEYCIVSN